MIRIIGSSNRSVKRRQGLGAVFTVMVCGLPRSVSVDDLRATSDWISAVDRPRSDPRTYSLSAPSIGCGRFEGRPAAIDAPDRRVHRMWTHLCVHQRREEPRATGADRLKATAYCARRRPECRYAGALHRVVRTARGCPCRDRGIDFRTLLAPALRSCELVICRPILAAEQFAQSFPARFVDHA